MPPTDEDDDLDGDEPGETEEDDEADEAEDDGPEAAANEDVITTGEQRLVRLPRRPAPPPPTNREGEPANRPPAPPDRRPHRRPEPPPPAKARRPRRPAPANAESVAAPPASPEPPPMNHVAPLPAPAMPAPAPSHAADGNILLAFEETLKMFPAASQTIAVERLTGAPAHWMLTERPRTANELYAAIKRLHGRNGETTYKVTFQDGAGHGNGGQISMPSTLDEPLPPGTPAANPVYGAPPTHYAAPVPAYVHPSPAASGTPFDAMLAMQKQMFEMVQSMTPKPAVAPPAPPAPPATPDTTSLLAMQKQMFEMMQQMQGVATGHAPPPPPQQPTAPPPAGAPPPPVDQATALLAMQKQMFEMMQAMQASAAGRAPPPAAPTFAAPTPATDSSAAMLAMQKQMFDMMLTMMQTAQRGAAPAGGPPPPGGPYYRPRYGGTAHDPNAPQTPPSYDPRYPPPSARPQTPSEQLREAASVFRDFRRVADELGIGGQATEPPEPEDDDNPVRVIDMGPAKGVINRSDGSLRGFETMMANLPDVLKWVGEQRVELRKAKDEDRRRQQPQLPPGYVMAGPDYVPPDGYVAVPVDQIPPQTQSTLPEPPTDMPPPIAEPAPAPQRRPWGMPTRG